jgi:acid phosphatase
MRLRGGVSLLALAISMAGASSLARADDDHRHGLDAYKHIVVIYQENHSFDNLYGQWGQVGGDRVNGQPDADTAHTTQVRQDNTTAYQCLLQNDVNLTSPTPLATTCVDNSNPMAPFNSHFQNKPFAIEDFIAAADTTCPNPLGAFAPNGFAKGTGLPGGCTKDIVHRYYNEQYQINRGRQNRYVTASDAFGLAMGYYKTKNLPIYAYLHGHGAPNYVIADSFFQGAFGGSFLNHQWLAAAATPLFTAADNTGGPNDLHSVVDANGMPTNNAPLYVSPLGANGGTANPGGPRDSRLTASCNPPAPRPATPAGVACGDFAINTIQPFNRPFQPGTAVPQRLPPLTNPTLGERLTAKHVDWAWYSGGWSNANGDTTGPGWTNGNTPGVCGDPHHFAGAVYPNCPDVLFQFHHQAYNYFANFAPGTAARAAHLRDEAEFIQAAHTGTLKPVSFIKPIGEENEHPGYTDETDGSNHLVDLIKAVLEGPNGRDTLIIVTYDEFGGQWDHVPPPPFQRHGRAAQRADQWGPGTRIPALLVSKQFKSSGVAHEDFDTTSVLKLIERRFGLQPLVTRQSRNLAVALEAANDHDQDRDRDHDDRDHDDHGHH